MTGISKYILGFIVILWSVSLIAQKKDAIMMSPWKVKMFAKDAIEIGDIYTAIDYYEALTQAKPEKYKYKYELAHLYRKSRNYKKAEENYKKAYDGNEAKFIEALFYYALMQKMNGKYEEAAENLLKFRKKSKNLKNRRYYRKIVNIEMQGCQMAPVLMDSVLKVLITHLDTSVNKAHIDFAPVSVDKETMIYASMKADDVEYYDVTDTTTVLPVRKFYKAKRVGGGWKTIGELEGAVNDNEFNVGNGAFSPDGKKFFFTKSYRNWENRMVSQLYVSRRKGESWGEPELLPEPINDSRYTTTMPAIGTESTKNQEVIYFVSDRPGGKGGLDIWFTVWDKKKHEYKEPKNCGSKINSLADEITPFYDMETRRLYFSSTGLPGLGGYDIFKTTGEMRRWSPPVNFGYPVNSNTDDIYYAVSKDRERSFFVSNREGGVALLNPTCCDDIYEFRWTEYIHIGIEGFAFEKLDTTKTDTLQMYIENLPDNTVKGFNVSSIDTIPPDEEKFFVNDTLRLNNAVLSLYLSEIEDGKEESYLVKRIPADKEANYFFDLEQGNDYKIIAECDGYFNNQVKVSTKTMSTSDTLFKSIELKKIPLKSIVLDNIYYEFDKANLTEEAKQTIDTTLLKILEDNPKLIVEISSHTDSKGNDDYNLKLSQKRAESVVKYLVNKNVDELRLIAKGYGETQPIAANKNTDGTDNPEGRQKNRRTEFKVIGSSDQFSSLNRSGLIIKRNSETNAINGNE